MELLFFIPILILTLVFGYLNSLNGAATIVATLIASRALRPWQAVGLTAAGMAVGTYLLGVAVATTIGVDLVVTEAQTATVLLATLTACITWVSFAVWLRIPSSATQAFIGSLAGVVWIGYGLDAVSLDGFSRVLLALFLSPVLGVIGGYWLVKLCYRLSQRASPRINNWFKGGQVLMCGLLAVAYGANDGQKIMGILVFGLIATRLIHSFAVPPWAVALSGW
jgi:PiT family inorganic phosphate transporter